MKPNAKINLKPEEKEQAEKILPTEKAIKYYRSKILNLDAKSHTAKIQITTEDIDRDKEILLLDSWKKNKKSYEDHPVLVSSHRYDNLMNQIGEAVKMDWDKMQFDFQWYAGLGNPEADWGWTLAEKGAAMFSVGFIPQTVLRDEAIPEKYRALNPRAILPDNELLEVSQVIVGSNRGALQLGVENPNAEHLQYAYEVMKSFDGKIMDFGEKTAIVPEPVKVGPDSTLYAPVDIKDIKELTAIIEIYKSGRIISEKNRGVIKDAMTTLTLSLKALKELLDLSEPEKDDEEKEFEAEVLKFLERNRK